MRSVRLILAGIVVGALAFVGSTGVGTHASAATLPPQPLKIVLLGDSYSAGNGARDASGNRDYFGPKGCYRSHSNWASQYVDYLRLQGYAVTFINRACSGAVSDDMLHDRNMGADRTGFMTLPVGTTDDEAQQQITAADPCNTFEYPDEEYWTYGDVQFQLGTFEYTCTRWLRAQVDAVGPDTDLVLFTIGGNDIGFSNIVKQCFVPGYRDPGDCRDHVQSASALLSQVHDRVLNVVNTMRGRGLREDARVVLGGYPLLSLDDDYTLYHTNIFGFVNDTYAAAQEVRSLGLAGDAAQDQIVADANIGHPGQVIHLRGVPELFAGHEPDPAFTSRNPDRWLWELLETKIQLEWYHMNPVGHYEYAQLLDQGGTYGAGTQAGPGADVDIVLVLDTTGSMGSSIDAVRQDASAFIDDVQASTTSSRFALVTYKDQPAWTGDPSDYASRVDQDFTTNPADVKNALNAINVSGGGDFPESMYSGLMTGLGLDWRPGVEKVVVVLADAPPHDPEPVSGYTAADVIAKAFSVDPAQVYALDVGAAVDGSLASVINQTGGQGIDVATAGDVAVALNQAIHTALAKPYAWINGPYVTQIGNAVTLDGSGSFSPSGGTLTYEWDYDSDGTFDQTTTSPLVTHTFAVPYSGPVTLRVTDDQGRTGVATTHVGATDDGDETPRADDNCPDVDNQGQEDYDGDGIGDACDPTPGWELPDLPGVTDVKPDGNLYPFDGFKAPVDNPPVANTLAAGQSVPVKFRLGGDQGLDILASGSPTSVRVDCDTSAPKDPIETTTTSQSGLQYDATSGQYTYVWKTAKAWAGTCRRLTLDLKDGSEHTALFQFK
jgi:lysophospholipase L1-like esterase